MARRFGMIEIGRRLWHRWRGEQIVAVTFWPTDYRRGSDYRIDGQVYRITRYFHADDYRYFEVWGLPSANIAHAQEPPVRPPADAKVPRARRAL